MSRILILLLALIPILAQAQDLIKEEKKARKEQLKAEKKEKKRIQDSIWRAMEDERERRLEAEWRKANSTSLLIVTPYDSAKAVFDQLVCQIMQDGIVPAFLDKEYYIIRTPRKSAGIATYDIAYSVFMQQGNVCVRGAAVGYGSVAVSSGMFSSETDMAIPLEYGSTDGSTAKTAWNEIEHYLLSIEHSEAIYE